ncbi:hypothetical protein KC887_02840 [Candidatus Kaiserbacteria bacterium]|nr:hypothetical protein [Candidatus Kaiserbacteria bacterium]
MEFNVGDRVKTEHGMGTVVGIESFVDELLKPQKVVMSVNEPWLREVSAEINRRHRVVIQLDPDHTWSFNNALYAEWRDKLEWQ